MKNLVCVFEILPEILEGILALGGRVQNEETSREKRVRLSRAWSLWSELKVGKLKI